MIALTTGKRIQFGIMTHNKPEVYHGYFEDNGTWNYVELYTNKKRPQQNRPDRIAYRKIAQYKKSKKVF